MPCPDSLTSGIGTAGAQAMAICQIVANFGTTAAGTDWLECGTGIAFFNRNTSTYIATAAHTIWSPELQRYCNSARLNFGRIGQAIPISRMAQNWWVPEAYMKSDYADPEWDFGVFRVNRLASSEVQPIALYRSAAPYAAPARICGYPSEDDYADRGLPFHGSTALASAGLQNFAYGEITTYRGMSGGPLLRTEQGRAISLGIHVRGEAPDEPRRAVRFSHRNLAIIGSWINETL